MSNLDDAKSRLSGVLKHLRYAIEEATKQGTPKFGILVQNADGSGKIFCRFDCDFIEDVALVIGKPRLSSHDRIEAMAEEFVQTHGLRRS